MSIGPFTNVMFRLEHRHGDGSWSHLEQVHHDPSELDQERDWDKGQLYACTTCPELVRIGHSGDSSVSDSSAR